VSFVSLLLSSTAEFFALACGGLKRNISLECFLLLLVLSGNLVRR